MPSSQRVLDRGGLMRIQLFDAARPERLPEPGVERFRKRRQPGGDRGQTPNRRHMKVRRVGPVEVVAAEALEGGIKRAVGPMPRRGEHGGAS